MAVSNTSRDPQLAEIATLLDDLRRLAILQLLASGVQASHIAQALGKDKSVISKMLPVRDIQKHSARRATT